MGPVLSSPEIGLSRLICSLWFTFEANTKIKMGSVMETRFWQDTWMVIHHLMSKYHDLYCFFNTSDFLSHSIGLVTKYYQSNTTRQENCSFVKDFEDDFSQ